MKEAGHAVVHWKYPIILTPRHLRAATVELHECTVHDIFFYTALITLKTQMRETHSY